MGSRAALPAPRRTKRNERTTPSPSREACDGKQEASHFGALTNAPPAAALCGNVKKRPVWTAAANRWTLLHLYTFLTSLGYVHLQLLYHIARASSQPRARPRPNENLTLCLLAASGTIAMTRKAEEGKRQCVMTLTHNTHIALGPASSGLPMVKIISCVSSRTMQCSRP